MPPIHEKPYRQSKHADQNPAGEKQAMAPWSRSCAVGLPWIIYFVLEILIFAVVKLRRPSLTAVALICACWPCHSFHRPHALLMSSALLGFAQLLSPTGSRKDKNAKLRVGFEAHGRWP